MPHIEVRDVSLAYDTPAGRVVGVERASFDIEQSQFLCLVGPSGCGKTTTLRMINRLIRPSSGRIELDGVDAAKLGDVQLRRQIGYVIQNAGLFPHRLRQAAGGKPGLPLPRIPEWRSTSTARSKTPVRSAWSGTDTGDAGGLGVSVDSLAALTVLPRESARSGRA